MKDRTIRAPFVLSYAHEGEADWTAIIRISDVRRIDRGPKNEFIITFHDREFIRAKFSSVADEDDFGSEWSRWVNATP